MNAPLARWVILQSILVAAVTAAFYGGALDRAFSPEMAPYCGALAALTGVGLLAIAAGRTEVARWLAPKMPAFALVFTIAGLSTAIQNAGGDQAAAFVGVGLALLSTAFGIVGWLVLSLNLRVCCGSREDG